MIKSWTDGRRQVDRQKERERLTIKKEFPLPHSFDINLDRRAKLVSQVG